MPRLLDVSACAFAAMLALVAPANAQPYSWFTTTAQCDAGTNTIGFGGYDLEAHPEVVGFDVYRSNSSLCGDPIRITDTPLPRTPNQAFSHQFVDTALQEGYLYRYHFVGVDAGRTTTVSLYHMFQDPGSSDAVYAGCNAAKGHGTVVDWGWTVFIDPCPNSCLPGFHLESGVEELRPYLGLPVQVYGFMGFTVEGWGLDLDSWSFLSCTVAVDNTQWSNVKRLFQ